MSSFVIVESTVLRPEGGKYALDEVFKPLPGGGTMRLTPRSRSYQTLEELDEDVRAEVRARRT